MFSYRYWHLLFCLFIYLYIIVSGAPLEGIFWATDLALAFSGQHFSWDFLLVEVKYPILGMDFLRHYKLAVGVAAGQLVNTETIARLSTASTGSAGEVASVLAATPLG